MGAALSLSRHGGRSVLDFYATAKEALAFGVEPSCGGLCDPGSETHRTIDEHLPRATMAVPQPRWLGLCAGPTIVRCEPAE